MVVAMQSMVVASATEITDALLVAMMIIYAGASGYTPAISLRSSSSAVYLSMSLTFLTPMSVLPTFWTNLTPHISWRATGSCNRHLTFVHLSAQAIMVSTPSYCSSYCAELTKLAGPTS